MAFEYPREAIAHLLARFADNDGPRNVGRTVLVLSAGIDQEQLVRADMAGGGAGPPGGAKYGAWARARGRPGRKNVCGPPGGAGGPPPRAPPPLSWSAPRAP